MTTAMHRMRTVARALCADASSENIAANRRTWSNWPASAIGLSVPAGRVSRKAPDTGRSVYATRVDEKLTRAQYYADRRFARKKPGGGSYAAMRGDNVQPTNTFEQHEQYALVSQHFFYFGANAVAIPKQFATLERAGRDSRAVLNRLTSTLLWSG
jgi:putative DNA base modification enzyme with NMAD domain